MQGRARGRKGERKTHHITSYHHIIMEFGGYLLNVAKTPRAQEIARAKRKTHHITSYHHIIMEFGGYLLNVAKTPRAQEIARAKRKGSYPTEK